MFSNMTYEEFIAYVVGYGSTEKINGGDFCRITVTSDFGSQYIYFTAP